jgi:hypothetical protein
MLPALKFPLKCLIGWFLLVSCLFITHFLIRPSLWPQVGRLLLGCGAALFIVVTLAGFIATCSWVVSQFRLFDDEYWY